MDRDWGQDTARYINTCIGASTWAIDEYCTVLSGSLPQACTSHEAFSAYNAQHSRRHASHQHCQSQHATAEGHRDDGRAVKTPHCQMGQAEREVTCLAKRSATCASDGNGTVARDCARTDRRFAYCLMPMAMIHAVCKNTWSVESVDSIEVLRA